MKTLLAALLCCQALAAPVLAAKEEFKVMSASELRMALDSKRPPAVFDANGARTRSKQGVIPGAKLLSSYKDYDAAKELPADKATPLVFYCANTFCTASHSAARKALAAGYSDVRVMSDGIEGWLEAGYPANKVSTK